MASKEEQSCRSTIAATTRATSHQLASTTNLASSSSLSSLSPASPSSSSSHRTNALRSTSSSAAIDFAAAAATAGPSHRNTSPSSTETYSSSSSTSSSSSSSSSASEDNNNQSNRKRKRSNNAGIGKGSKTRGKVSASSVAASSSGQRVSSKGKGKKALKSNTNLPSSTIRTRSRARNSESSPESDSSPTPPTPSPQASSSKAKNRITNKKKVVVKSATKEVTKKRILPIAKGAQKKKASKSAIVTKKRKTTTSFSSDSEPVPGTSATNATTTSSSTSRKSTRKTSQASDQPAKKRSRIEEEEEEESEEETETDTSPQQSEQRISRTRSHSSSNLTRKPTTSKKSAETPSPNKVSLRKRPKRAAGTSRTADGRVAKSRSGSGKVVTTVTIGSSQSSESEEVVGGPTPEGSHAGLELEGSGAGTTGAPSTSSGGGGSGGAASKSSSRRRSSRLTGKDKSGSSGTGSGSSTAKSSKTSSPKGRKGDNTSGMSGSNNKDGNASSQQSGGTSSSSQASAAAAAAAAALAADMNPFSLSSLAGGATGGGGGSSSSHHSHSHAAAAHAMSLLPALFGDTSSAGGGAGGASGTEGDIMDADMGRLQALLEARGLPPQLFGALAPRVQNILNRNGGSSLSGMTSNASKAHSLIQSLESGDEGLQLQAVMEMCQMLVMGNEDTLTGFPIKQVVPALTALLAAGPGSDGGLMAGNYEIANHACRALTYMMESLPRSSAVVVDAVPAFLAQLSSIQCMDVAEQSLTALEMLSRRHSKNILHAKGVSACLTFLDFFSISAQRSALSITANCCQNLTNDEFHFIQEALPTLAGHLNIQDKKCIESLCLAFSRLVESYQASPAKLEEIAAHQVLPNLQALLAVTPPLISTGTFQQVLRMMSTMCASCPQLAVQLLKLNISDTLRYLLLGPQATKEDADHIELVSRSPQELFEITSLIVELMPSLPTDGIFIVDNLLIKVPATATSSGGVGGHISGHYHHGHGGHSVHASAHSALMSMSSTSSGLLADPDTLGHQTVNWMWKDDRSGWHTYSHVDTKLIETAHQAGEDEVSLHTMGRSYIIDFNSMQQINEDTGTMRAIQRKVNAAPPPRPAPPGDSTDPRITCLQEDPALLKSFIKALFGVLYEVYSSSAGPTVRHKCLKSLLRIIYYSPAELLQSMLKSQQVSSHVSAMLASPDLKVIVGAIQMANILMEKLPDVFAVHFRREGVFHQMSILTKTTQQVMSASTSALPTVGTAGFGSMDPPSTPLYGTTPPTSAPPMTTVSIKQEPSTPPTSTAPSKPLPSSNPFDPLGSVSGLTTSSASPLEVAPPAELATLLMTSMAAGPSDTTWSTALSAGGPPGSASSSLASLSYSAAMRQAMSGMSGLLDPPPPFHQSRSAEEPSLDPSHRSSEVQHKKKRISRNKACPVAVNTSSRSSRKTRSSDQTNNPQPPTTTTTAADHHHGRMMSSQPPTSASATESAIASYLASVGAGQLHQPPAGMAYHEMKASTSSSPGGGHPHGRHGSAHGPHGSMSLSSSPRSPFMANLNREKIKGWIKDQAVAFEEKYNPPPPTYLDDTLVDTASAGDESLGISGTGDTVSLVGSPAKSLLFNNNNGAHNHSQALHDLTAAITLLKTTPEVSLRKIKLILSDGDLSSFELNHSGLIATLLKYLTHLEPEEGDHPLAITTEQDAIDARAKRIRLFLNVFLSSPVDNVKIITSKMDLATDNGPLCMLVAKLNACVSQLEQFPVRVHDVIGSSMGGSVRGQSALKFFNTHQLKCNLQRHPSCTNLRQWRAGTVKIDPLALVQAIERYLVSRGYGRVREEDEDTDDDNSEEELDDNMAAMMIGSASQRHRIEFVINEQVLPYGMTVYQAIRQFNGMTSSSSSGHGHHGGGQYGHMSHDPDGDLMMDGDMMGSPMGFTNMWVQTHTIYYRPVSDSTLASAGLCSPSSSGLTNSATAVISSTGGKNKSTGKSDTKSGGSKKGKDELWTEGKVTPVPCPLEPFLKASLPSSVTVMDPSLETISLLRVIHALSRNWGWFYDLNFQYSPAIPQAEFINTKLTAKANRQLQDPLVIMTGNLPAWLSQIAYSCPFLFPFETRHLLFYVTCFDRDRALQRLLDSQPEMAAGEASERVAPRLERRKRTVSRNDLLRQTEIVLQDVASSKALLEIQYDQEVGTGLGPTLEFYALVSKELQRADLDMWRGEAVSSPQVIPPGSQPSSSSKIERVASTSSASVMDQEWAQLANLASDDSNDATTVQILSRDDLDHRQQQNRTKQDTDADEGVKFVYSAHGLFPAPLGRGVKASQVSRVRNRFKLLGKFMAKALMDSRMVDIPLSLPFYEWLLGREINLSLRDMHHIDQTLARSVIEMEHIAQRKAKMEKDKESVKLESLTMDGCPIEDLNLDFTLPGYPTIELRKGGKDLEVSTDNLPHYVRLLTHWTLVEGVQRQMEAFREGFESVLHTGHLSIFYSEELEQLFCGSRFTPWDPKMLDDVTRTDHGYTHESKPIRYLFEVLSSFGLEDQRKFLQFVTGSPRLPVGGLKALSPTLTIVRKTADLGESPDDFLPSVMTCVNYLKLPEYSTVEVTRLKLKQAINEGLNSFHLS